MPPGARIGVMLDRSPELIATVLGVLRAGAAVVPLDVSYPRTRIDAMINRVQTVPCHFRDRRSSSTAGSTCDNDIAGNRPRQCGLRPLHIRFDGRTQGRHDAAPCTGQSDRMAEPAAVRCGRRLDAAVRTAVVRRIVPGDLLDAVRWRHITVVVRERSARIRPRWCASWPPRVSRACSFRSSHCRRSPRPLLPPAHGLCRCEC